MQDEELPSKLDVFLNGLAAGLGSGTAFLACLAVFHWMFPAVITAVVQLVVALTRLATA